MSVVGELPLDITHPPELAHFEPQRMGHRKRPSHRRTPSQFMDLIDGQFMGGPYEFGFGGHRKAESAPLCRETLEKMGSAFAGQSGSPVCDGTSTQSAEGEVLEDMYDAFFMGGKLPAVQKPLVSPTRRTKSSASLLSGRSGSSSSIFGMFLRKSRGGEFESAGSAGGRLTDDRCYEEVSDSDTVVEFLGDSDDDEIEFYANDMTNMHNDLYMESSFFEAEFGKIALGGREDDRGLDTIAESALESQKSVTEEFKGHLKSNSLSFSKIAEEPDEFYSKIQEEPEESESVEMEDSEEDATSPMLKAAVVENKDVDCGVQSLMPESMASDILHDLHNEIVQEMCLENQEQEAGQEVGQESAPESPERESAGASGAVDVAGQKEEGTVWWGMRWVRVVPDKDLVRKVHQGIGQAGRYLYENWHIIPVVALPVIILAMH